jgi:hypothetical protein
MVSHYLGESRSAVSWGTAGEISTGMSEHLDNISSIKNPRSPQSTSLILFILILITNLITRTPANYHSYF